MPKCAKWQSGTRRPGFTARYSESPEASLPDGDESGKGTRPIGTIALVSILLVALVFLLAYYQYDHLPMVPSPQTSASSPTLQKLQIEIVDAATLKGDHAYSPSPIKLVIGSNNSVVFRNNDSVSGGVSHTAADRGGYFNTGVLRFVETSETIVLQTPGTYEYYCEIHPQMNGKIIVQPPPA